MCDVGCHWLLRLSLTSCRTGIGIDLVILIATATLQRHVMEFCLVREPEFCSGMSWRQEHVRVTNFCNRSVVCPSGRQGHWGSESRYRNVYVHCGDRNEECATTWLRDSRRAVHSVRTTPQSEPRHSDNEHELHVPRPNSCHTSFNTQSPPAER